MKRITSVIRPIICMAVLLFAMTTAVMGCYQKDPDPIEDPSGTSEVEATPIPAVNRQAELADAKSKNPDAMAWLCIPGAEVDDPVMQAEDNGFYLNRDELREYSTWGCYYADCRNHLSGRDALDTNTVIYGHSSNDCDPDGVRFTKLYRYMDADFAKEHPYIYLFVDGEDMIFQITALFVTDIGFDYKYLAHAEMPSKKPCCTRLFEGKTVTYRRCKLHIVRPAASGRTNSFRCASSSHKICDFAGALASIEETDK